MKNRFSGNRAFTLVELIIVIIILGILAALAIPQFSTSTEDARVSTQKANLAILRNAINLYYHEHNSDYPGAVKIDGTGDATDAAANPVAFQDQLLQFTKKDGETSADKDAAFKYGPYLGAIPFNVVNDLATVAVIDTASPLDDGDVPGTVPGWIFSKQTGEIRAIAADDTVDPL